MSDSSPDLLKLRRFALSVALVLFTYSVAAGTLDFREFSLLGIRVGDNPALIGAGLAVASFFSLVRFGYYGMMLTPSPARERKELYKRAEFMTKEEADRIEKVYPVVFGKIAADIQISRDAESIRNEKLIRPYRVEVFEIPAVVRWACRFQQADYTSPVWLNVIALGLWVLSWVVFEPN